VFRISLAAAKNMSVPRNTAACDGDYRSDKDCVAGENVDDRMPMDGIDNDELGEDEEGPCRPRRTGVLKGAVICCSGFERAKKEDIKKLTTQLDGNYVDGKNLRAQKVTHLIAGATETVKYLDAMASKNIKVVRSEWLTDCAREMKIQDESDYRVSEFTFTVICTTGYEVAQRDKVKAFVQKFGGTYTHDMELSFPTSPTCTTHLIAATPTGAKFGAAAKYNDGPPLPLRPPLPPYPLQLGPHYHRPLS
jgi:hypothetical protein